MLTTMTNQEFLLERAFSNTHTKTCQSQSLKVTDCLCWVVPLKKEFDVKWHPLNPGLNKFKILTSTNIHDNGGIIHQYSMSGASLSVKDGYVPSSASNASNVGSEIGKLDENENFVSKAPYKAIDSVEISQDGLVTITPKNNKKARIRPLHRLKTHVLNLCSKKTLRQIVPVGESPTCFHCLARLNKQLTSTVSKTLVPPSNYDI